MMEQGTEPDDGTKNRNRLMEQGTESDDGTRNRNR